jgi:hypothetical protein
MGHPHTALRYLFENSPLLPDEGWSDPEEARDRIGLASGGEEVMIRFALSLWLDEPIPVSEIGRLDSWNASVVLHALAMIADHDAVMHASL